MKTLFPIHFLHDFMVLRRLPNSAFGAIDCSYAWSNTPFRARDTAITPFVLLVFAGLASFALYGTVLVGAIPSYRTVLAFGGRILCKPARYTSFALKLAWFWSRGLIVVASSTIKIRS